jgi:hypothetical protein
MSAQNDNVLIAQSRNVLLNAQVMESPPLAPAQFEMSKLSKNLSHCRVNLSFLHINPRKRLYRQTLILFAL